MGIRNYVSYGGYINMKITKLLPLIGISILIYIIQKYGISNIYKTFIQANFYYVFISLIFVGIGMLALTYKWVSILKTQGIFLNYWY